MNVRTTDITDMTDEELESLVAESARRTVTIAGLTFTANETSCIGCGSHARLVVDEDGTRMCCIECEYDRVKTDRNGEYASDPFFIAWDRKVSKAWSALQ